MFQQRTVHSAVRRYPSHDSERVCVPISRAPDLELLKPTLDALYAGFNDPQSAADPIHIVRRFNRRDDQEIVAFCAAALAFGRVGSVQTDPTKAKKELFHEIDDRPGYYLGAQVRYLDRAVLDILHYDNRGDPTAQSSELRDMAWKTRFDAVALRVETGGEWTVLLQALKGDTAINPFRLLLWEFDSQSALLAKRWGRHLLAARYDVGRLR